MSTPKPVSEYLNYLPAIFQAAEPDSPDFLGRFLLAFEYLFTGGDPDHAGLEEILNGTGDSSTISSSLVGLQRYFTPGPDLTDRQHAPNEFLEWLGGWVALTEHILVDAKTRRRLIANAVPLYSQRGTGASLRQILKFYTEPENLVIEVDEQNPFQVGVSKLGKDTCLNGGPPHFFVVRVKVPEPPQRSRIEHLVKAVVDGEKPAHTTYRLELMTPTLKIGDRSRIGQSTFLSKYDS